MLVRLTSSESVSPVLSPYLWHHLQEVCTLQTHDITSCSLLMIRFIHDFSENLAGQLLYPMGLVGISVSLQVQDCNEPFSLECFKETAGFTITLMHFNISYNEMNNSGPKVRRKPHTVSTSPCGACTHQLHLPGTQLNPATTAHAAHYQNQNPWGRGPLCGGSWVWISAQNTPRFHHWLSSIL